LYAVYRKKDWEELNETRFLLEKGAAELAVPRADQEKIKELEKICQHMFDMAENGYEQGFDEADLRFHTVLVKAAHNEKILNVYERANIMLSS
jgi:DNA-binding GntR family transcriptional regulator